MAPKRPNPSWRQLFTFMLLLARCEEKEITGSERYFRVMRAVQNAIAIGYPAGFSVGALGKTAWIQIPSGRLSWTVAAGESYPAVDEQEKIIKDYATTIHQQEKK